MSADSGPEDRHARLETHPTTGTNSSLTRWWRVRNPVRVILTVLLVGISRYLPSIRAKNWLYRRLGMAVGPGGGWALAATPDVIWPDRITVGAHAIIGYDATILCHEFLQGEYRVGDVVIGDRAMIGAGAIVLPGVEIGADARVAANSLVADDVAAGATVAGVPAEQISERTPEADN